VTGTGLFRVSFVCTGNICRSPMGEVVFREMADRAGLAGRFAVTSELNPPDSADPREVYDRAVVLGEVCDAINAVDASGAHVHMSSVGICALLTRAGYAVVMQIACRDKNRIAIQGDVLGAAAMGVQNILCLTGDGVQCGDQPEAKPVFDLDSISLLETVRTMRDESRFLSGRKLTSRPQVFIGAAVILGGILAVILLRQRHS